MKATDIVRRVLAGGMTLIISLSLVSDCFAEDSEAEDANGSSTVETKWVEVGTTSKQKLTPDKAFESMAGTIRSAARTIDAALSSPSTLDKNSIVSQYGTMLACMDWITKNAYTTDTAGGSNKISIFQLPGDTATGSSFINELDAAELFTLVKTTTDSIRSSNVLDNNSSAILSGSQLMDYASDGSVVGYNNYLSALKMLLTSYIDASVCQVLADKELKDQDLSGGTISGVNLGISLDNDTTKTRQLLSKYGDDIFPLLDTARDLIAVYESVNDNGLEDMQLGETVYAGVQYNTEDLRNNLSGVVKTLYNEHINANTGTAVDTEAPTTADIDATNDPLYMLSNAAILNDQVVCESDHFELKDLGYHILAAGSCYDPFVSHAGNQEYIDVVKSSINEEDQEKVLKVLKVALNTKKPLYVADGKDGAWEEASELTGLTLADYRMAFLSDVLQIQTSATRAYVVIKGGMKPSEVDSSTWEYVDRGIGYNNQTTVKDNNFSGVTIVGSNTISATSDQVTLPIMLTSGKSEGFWYGDVGGYASSVGGLTSLIIHNAVKDLKDNEHVQNAEKEGLYLNGLGDIVLYDDTVVLPAIANPILYKYSADDTLSVSSAVDEVTTDGDSLEDDTYTGENTTKYETAIMGPRSSLDNNFTGYYPYTAAFMNHYPTARLNAQNQLSVTPNNDLDKYMLLVAGDRILARRIKSIGEVAQVTTFGAVPCAHIFGPSLALNSVEDPISALIVAEGDGGSNFLQQGLGFFGSIGRKIGSIFSNEDEDSNEGAGANAGYTGWGSDRRSHMLFITTGTVYSGDEIPVFPLQMSSPDTADTYVFTGTLLKNSALKFLRTTDANTGASVPSNSFYMTNFIESFLGEGMLGTQYKETLVKNYQMSYEDIVEDTGGRFLKFLVGLTDSTLDTLGHIDGVLAIKGPYSNKFFNLIMIFVQDFYLVIAICLLLVVAVKFVKGHYNMIYVCFIGAICVAGFELYANWLPNIIANVYNTAVNDAIENVVWNTVIYKAESYDETYKNSDRKDANFGDPKPYTATMTLYKLTSGEMTSIANAMGVDISDVRKGEVVYLDATAGIFLQGNEIKMSVDKLLVNNTMRGLYKSQWESLTNQLTTDATLLKPVSDFSPQNPYSIQLSKPYVSLETYYTPYDHIERAYMLQLNTFTNILRIKRNTFCYGNGALYKDSFVVRAFLESGIITAPGDDNILRNNIDMGLIANGWNTSKQQVVDLLNKYFYPQEDWLGLRKIFSQPDAGMQASLWGRIMRQRQWYTVDWQMTEEGKEEIWDLVLYINNQTKQFLIKNIDQIGYISDENAIKMVSLYSTTCFTHYMSTFGNWLYPNYINASDIELRDVLYGSMTTLKDRNFAYDGTVTNTVAINLGVFGVIFLLLIIITSVIFIFAVTYLVPILYALFGGILVFKMINDDGNAGLVKGYVKVTAVTSLLYLIYSLGLRLVEVGGYNWYGYFGCLIIIILCIYFMFWVILSVVQDMGELGNNTLTANLLRGLDNLTRGSVNRLFASTTRLSTNINYRRQAFNTQRYTRSYNVDDYQYPGVSRRGYAYNDGYDTGYRRPGWGRTFHYGSGMDYRRGSDFDDTNTVAWSGARRRDPLRGIRGISRNWGKRRTKQAQEGTSYTDSTDLN